MEGGVFLLGGEGVFDDGLLGVVCGFGGGEEGGLVVLDQGGVE